MTIRAEVSISGGLVTLEPGRYRFGFDRAGHLTAFDDPLMDREAVFALNYTTGAWRYVGYRDSNGQPLAEPERVRLGSGDVLERAVTCFDGLQTTFSIRVLGRQAPPTGPAKVVSSFGAVSTATAGIESIELAIGQRVFIGSRSCDVALDGVDVPERVELRREQRYLELICPRAVYYPLVNGRAYRRARMQPGDQFVIGHQGFRVLSGFRVEWSPGRISTIETGLAVTNLSLRYRAQSGSAETVLRDASFSVASEHLLVVVGPSGCGKSSLCYGILGEVERTGGLVRLNGIELRADHTAMSNLISFVPQSSALYSDLTVQETIRFAAELRKADGVEASVVAKRVSQVIADLNLETVRNKDVDQLSGGQRRRVSVALELLTEPQLLMLDEPTSGLDEGLDRRLMEQLRNYARGGKGRVVMVVTHALSNIQGDDEMLAIAAGTSGSIVGYAGTHSGLMQALGTQTPADAMEALRGGRQAPCTGLRSQAPGVRPLPSTGTPTPRPDRRFGGIGTQTRRELVRTFGGNRWLARALSWGLFSAITYAIGAISAPDGLIAGPSPQSHTAVLAMVTCIAFFSLSFSFTSISTDRLVLEREHRWGVSPGAAVISRFLALLPNALIVGITPLLLYTWTHGNHSQMGGANRLIPDVWAMLAIGGMLGVCTLATGLLISAVAGKVRQTVLVLMGFLAAEVVLSGMTIPLAESGSEYAVLRVLSWIVPTRWAVSSWAAQIGLAGEPVDSMWTHDTAHFAIGPVALALLTLGALVLTTVALRRQLHRFR